VTVVTVGYGVRTIADAPMLCVTRVTSFVKCYEQWDEEMSMALDEVGLLITFAA